MGMRVCWSTVLFNVREALEELDELCGDLELIESGQEPERNLNESRLAVALAHAYHHLNTAWRARGREMPRACGLHGVDAAIMLCSLLSLKGDEIERMIYSRRIKNELYEDAKRLVGRSGDVGAMLSRATERARAEAREISAMELFCLLGLETSLAELYQDKGLNRGMLNDLLSSCRSSQTAAEEVGDPIADLDGLIGLGSVKEEVRKLMALVH